MKPRKWAKEIKAWADGAEIEWLAGDEWKLCDDANQPQWLLNIEYRIKIQPKEPQYLYVYGWLENENICFNKSSDYPYIGKIKLEQD